MTFKDLSIGIEFWFREKDINRVLHAFKVLDSAGNPCAIILPKPESFHYLLDSKEVFV